MNLDRSSWKKVKLGDVAYEYSKRVDKPSESGFDKFVGSANIGQFDFRIKSWESTSDVESSMKQFQVDDYLLVRRSLYASDFRERAPLADFDGICSGDILTIRENPDKIAKGFLIGVLNSPVLWKYIVANASGSITRRIKWKELANYEFLLPPKDQQAKLAELLWAADELGERYVQLGTNLAKFRDTLVETVIQSTKNNVTLDTTGIISYGMGVPPKYNEKGVAIIRATNINGGEITEKDMLKALPEDISPGKRVFLSEGDIIVVRSGAYTGDVGYISMEWANTLAGYDLVYKPDRNKVNPIFIRDILLSKKIQSYFKSESTRSAQPHLNAEQLRATLIPAMDIKSQNAISEKINNLTLKYKETVLQIEKSKQIQKQLINQIFSA